MTPGVASVDTDISPSVNVLMSVSTSYTSDDYQVFTDGSATRSDDPLGVLPAAKTIDEEVGIGTAAETSRTTMPTSIYRRGMTRSSLFTMGLTVWRWITASRPYSNQVQVKVPPGPPAAPAIILAGIDDAGVEELSFSVSLQNSSKNETGFKLLQSINGGPFAAVKSSGTDGTAFQDSVPESQLRSSTTPPTIAFQGAATTQSATSDHLQPQPSH